MDSSHTQPYERSRPQYPRTASRSSTSTTNTTNTTNTRMTSQSANSSTSQIAGSLNSHAAHRYHHASCATPSSPRTTPRGPRLSREASTESTRQQAVSSFLQEKLQKERKAESDKIAALSRSNTEMSVSDLGRVSHSSPIQGNESEHRPKSSSAGSEKKGTEKKRGLGVNQMEQVISTLHKQNFDLKLELFHRRERQSVMEERIETLETEKAEVEAMNDKLVQEMEQRDKAVEEAVAMIITLEAKLEQFAKERNMVRQIEAEFSLDPYEQPTPQAKAPDVSQFEDEIKTLARMPSFLSERSENTENLRNVYLGVRGSVLSLPQVVEGSMDTDGPANGMASPSLSILSESSFISVYGQKNTPVDEPLSLDGVDGLPGKANGIKRPKTSLAKPAPSNRTARSNSMSTNGRGQFQSITNVIDQGSPLQRIERTYSKKEDGLKKEEPRPKTRDQNAGVSLSSSVTKSPGHRRTREEKREALRKVLTDSPGGVRLHDHALPPTPDTISTSTLRRFQNSNDTLSKQQINHQRSIGAMSDLSTHDEKLPEPPSGVLLGQPKPKMRDFSDSSYFENRIPIIQRPRSADETTVSHRRGNDWDSDSDDSDARSLESSLDIWMRESSTPDRTGRVSPDLFSFPNTAARSGWAVDAMFGPSNVYGGSADPERVLDLFPAQQALFAGSSPPPPPNRRSSLHARTGSNSRSPSMTKNTRVQKSPGRRYTRSRRNSDDPSIRAGMKTPVPPSQQPPSSDKKHYPPITGQQAVRNGLTKLFRRSLGGTSNPPDTPRETPKDTPASVAEPTFADIPRAQTAMGVPSWVNRSAAIDDDRDGATPPPIMRIPRQGRGAPTEIETRPITPGMDSMMPATPTTAIPVDSFSPEHGSSPRVVSATGNRRKWLPGFGRNSVKNKMG
ncbi:Fc.00g031650.m01.CDS01 [Cosmosporella sp. VM-42]